ncbi:Uncharacterised protein [Vibrio cholerae]|nr:Uncharacterised protein [Vibrio cholerae]CSI68146.1 Uncharacterised protein [Vibrio cholerae]
MLKASSIEWALTIWVLITWLRMLSEPNTMGSSGSTSVKTKILRLRKGQRTI